MHALLMLALACSAAAVVLCGAWAIAWHWHAIVELLFPSRPKRRVHCDRDLIDRDTVTQIRRKGGA